MPKKEKVFEEREWERDGERCIWESIMIKNPMKWGHKVKIVVAQLAEIQMNKWGSKSQIWKPRSRSRRRNRTKGATTESLVLEKWIIDMENHLEWCRMVPKDWVLVASGFLEDDVEEWYLQERQRRPFKNWEDFKLQVREQFIPRDKPSRGGRDGTFYLKSFGNSIHTFLSITR